MAKQKPPPSQLALGAINEAIIQVDYGEMMSAFEGIINARFAHWNPEELEVVDAYIDDLFHIVVKRKEK